MGWTYRRAGKGSGMRKGVLLAATIGGWLSIAPANAGDHRLGFGFHYWKTVDDLAAEGFGNLEDNGVAQVFSYQYLPGGLLRFEFNVEYFNKGFGGSIERAYSPQFFVLLGRFVYAGVGTGVTYSRGFSDRWSDPYYAARGGIELLLLPKLHLDLSANYRFNAWSELEHVETETLTLAAILRLGL